MKEKKPTCIEILEVINTYLITSFFIKSLLDIIKNTSFFDKKLKTYFLLALYYIKNI